MTQRVIKYRAWDGEQMLYPEAGDIIIHIDDGGLVVYQLIENDPDDEDAISDYSTKQINAEVMQFTGLLDKYGKEIYEGDIFEYEAWHGGPEHAMLEKSLKEQGKPLPSYKERRVILSHPYGHFITRKLDDITDMTYTGDTFYHTPATTAAWEIIGNIYTTPELVDPKMIER